MIHQKNITDAYLSFIQEAIDNNVRQRLKGELYALLSKNSSNLKKETIKKLKTSLTEIAEKGKDADDILNKIGKLKNKLSIEYEKSVKDIYIILGVGEPEDDDNDNEEEDKEDDKEDKDEPIDNKKEDTESLGEK